MKRLTVSRGKKECNDTKLGIMKKIFSVLVSAAAVCLFSCNPIQEETQQPVKVEFPDLIEKLDLKPGETVKYTFTPGADWELSVPTETYSWFWLEYAGRKNYKVSGKASEKPVEVDVIVSDVVELTQSRSCELTLKMGGESKVVARYERPAEGISMKIFPVSIVDGDFEMNQDSTDYKYSDQSTKEIELIWSEKHSDFRLPLLVKSNCEWSVSSPDYLVIDIPESTSGECHMTVTSHSLEEAVAEIVFMLDGEPVETLSVKVPSSGEISLYPALYENGEVVYVDGGYGYSAESSSSIALFWSGSDYRLPVSVKSKCDWELETPEWLSVEMPENTKGTSYFLLKGNPSRYPLEDTVEKMYFKNGQTVVHEVDVFIPGCKDKMSYILSMGVTSLEYDFSGNLQTAVGFSDIEATANVTSTNGARIFAVGMNDGRYTEENPAWFRVEISSWDSSSSAYVVQERTATFIIEDNEGTERSAMLFFLPESVDVHFLDLFTASGDAVKEEYASYAVHVLQYGTDMEYVTLASSEEERASAGLLFEIGGTISNNWFGQTDYKYTLTYNSPYSRDAGLMYFSMPFKSYKIFNGARVDKTNAADFWLSFQSSSEDNTTGIIGMYSNEDTPPTSPSTGYVVLYDVEDPIHRVTPPLAVIRCEYDPTTVTTEKFVVEFIGESAVLASQAGARLEEVTSGPLFDQFKEYVSASIYNLTYTRTDMPLSVSIPDNALTYSPNPYLFRHNFVVNDLNYDETVGEFSHVNGGVTIRMSMPEDGTEQTLRGWILFYDKDSKVVQVLICTLDLSGATK